MTPQMRANSVIEYIYCCILLPDNAASTSTALESPDDFELSASHAGSYFGKINGLTNISNWNLSKDLNVGKASIYIIK